MVMESSTERRRPAHPLAPYIGGKRHLADSLVARIERLPHRIYAEPFVGMGGVFLRRSGAPVEVMNDLNRDVATLFRVLQRHYVAFLEMFRFQLTTRADYDRLAATDVATLTDLERAARFLYLQRTAYGGKVAGRNFGYSLTGSARFDVTKIAPLLEAAHERLAGVLIECLPYDDFIARYDRPETLFYIDPPYWGCEGDYGAGLFIREDFARLALLLGAIKGRFILSINDVPEIRALFGRFFIEEAQTVYTIARDGNAAVSELIITGPQSLAEDHGLLL